MLIAGTLWLAAFGNLVQEKSFAGTWVVDWALTDAANDDLGGPGEPHGATIRLAVTQSAQVMTVQQGNHKVRRYNLDGSPSVNEVAGVDGQTTQVSRASLEAGRLRIVAKGARGEVTSIWTIDRGNLKIVTTRPNFDGPGLMSTALVFKRAVE